MITRTELENREYEELAKNAAKSRETKGRLIYEEPDDVRTEFQRDRDRIIHSKSFRRLMHKTQVFLAPEGDHFRTRLTHTIEVCQISRTVARSLGLNEDLVEAIALGHDLGHTPFGHNGEEVLNDIHPGGFMHNVQSLRVVDVLEYTQHRQGMNLTYEVRDGIVNHSGPNMPCTLEGQIVRICDRVAYINHDIDDALRSGVISQDDIPKESLALFGDSHRARINTMVTDLIQNSDGKDKISMSQNVETEMGKLRDWMFKNVYRNPLVKKEADLSKVERVISSLYNYYIEHPLEISDELQRIVEKDGVQVAAKDYIAGMTDRYALNKYNDIFVPKGWK